MWARTVALVVAACGGTTNVVTGPQPVAGSHRLSIDGIEIAIEVRGKGPVCIAHPGGPGLDAGYLRSDALERRFTVVYVDPIGTGASGKLAGADNYSKARDVAIVDGIRTKLGLDKICIVGHSYGGMVAQLYAVTHPTHVSGLFLYSTSPVTDDEWRQDVEANTAWFKDEPWFADAVAGIAAEDKATTAAELDAAIAREWPLFFADWSGHRAAYAPLVGSSKVAFDVYRRRDPDKFDLRHRLGVIHTTPTVIVAGDKDFICGVKPSTWLSQAIGGSKLVVIERAGHFAHVEQPAAFAAAVDEFAELIH